MVEREEVLRIHKMQKGQTEIIGKMPLQTMQDLSIAYTPGVAYVSEEVSKDKELAFEYTSKSNTIAIVTDGTRILGLGDIGPEAGLPVMEGKALLFKRFGGVDAVPICLDTKDENEIISIVTKLAPTFGGINIEDIKSPRCINVAEALSRNLSIPVLHDDRQGTGVVTLAAVVNALKLTGKGRGARIVLNGGGAAGYGIAELLYAYGLKNTIVIDTKGAIYKGRQGNDSMKERIADMTNPNSEKGDLESMVNKADILIGVSVRGAFTKAHIQRMAEKPVVMALANPYPEIEYQAAKEAGAYIVATGRSDTPNQVNNVLAFPGIMRGMLDVRAKALTNEMLIAAAVAIAKGAGRNLSTEYIIPAIMSKGVAMKLMPEIAAAVGTTAIKAGQARVTRSREELKKNAKLLLKKYMKMEKKLAKLNSK